MLCSIRGGGGGGVWGAGGGGGTRAGEKGRARYKVRVARGGR